jgi:hypothetical protein
MAELTRVRSALVERALPTVEAVELLGLVPVGVAMREQQGAPAAPVGLCSFLPYINHKRPHVWCQVGSRFLG